MSSCSPSSLSTLGVSAPRRVWLTAVISPVPWLVSSPSPPMLVSLTSVSVTVIFYGMGSLAPSPTLLFYSGLRPAEYTHTGMDYPHRDEYTQAEQRNLETRPQVPIEQRMNARVCFGRDKKWNRQKFNLTESVGDDSLCPTS